MTVLVLGEGWEFVRVTASHNNIFHKDAETCSVILCNEALPLLLCPSVTMVTCSVILCNEALPLLLCPSVTRRACQSPLSQC